MKTTTYTCDKCKATDTNNKLDLVAVGVFVGQYQSYHPYGIRGEKIQFTQEWCRQCRVKFGLTHPKEDRTVTPDSDPITLDQLVHDVAYEAAREALANA